MNKQMMRIKKAHVGLMRHPETALYSGVMLMGVSEVVDTNSFTAYTDGVNKKYANGFLETIKKDSQVRGLVLHENLHVALKHIQRGVSMYKHDRKVANMAADYVVNDIIHNIKGCVQGTDERIVELPEGALQDAMFHNWSMKEVFDYLIRNNPPSDGGESDGSYSPSADQHDFEGSQDVTYEQAKEISQAIDRAIREGGILAGRMGGNTPRAITDMLEPKVDWKAALMEFVTSSTKGVEEASWRKMSKRYLANDMYVPGYETDTIGEVIVGIDTSGSIGGKELNEFASELASVCMTCCPEKVRVIWWDASVHGEQVFESGDYNNIAGLLKPLGGGGTHVGCVSEYINANKLTADAVIILTDGYVEDNVQWNINTPTLWMVTQNKSFEPPAGIKVLIK